MSKNQDKKIIIGVVIVILLLIGLYVYPIIMTSQDDATGEEGHVDNSIRTVTVDGDTNSMIKSEMNNNISTINITTLRSVGSGNIDMRNATININSNNVSTTLEYDNSSDIDWSNSFTTESIEDTSDYELDASSDRIVITISLSALNDDLQAELRETDEIEIDITVEEGRTTKVEKSAPSVIEEGERYRL